MTKNDRNLKALIVDDDPMALPELETLLDPFFEVKAFTSSRDALSYFLSEKPDLVVTDIKMPGLTGIDLLEKIKQSAPRTLVVMSTGTEDLDSALDAVRAGAFDYWRKQLPAKDKEILVHRALNTLKIQTENNHLAMTARQQESLAQLGLMVSSIIHEIKAPLFKSDLKVKKTLKKLIEVNKSTKSEASISLLNASISELEAIEELTARIFKIIKSQGAIYRDRSVNQSDSCNIRETIQDALNIADPIFSASHVKVIAEMTGAEEIKLHVGRVELGQVLVNLLINASHAVEKTNQKWVKIDYVRSGDTVEIRVTDSGEGISATNRESVFDTHFTTKEVGKGTGLGLPTSRKLIEAFGGELFLDSKSKDTCFVIRLKVENSLKQAS